MGISMQVTENKAEGLKHEFTIVVGADAIAEKTNARLEEIKQSAHLKGFRPGKAPVSLLKKLYGESVRGEVLQATINEATHTALEERELRPAMEPKIEVKTFEEDKDLEYTLEVEVLPEIEMMDFATLKLERPVAEVADTEVDEAVQRLAEQQRSFADKPDDDAAEEGDVVVIDFLGKIDDEPFEGGAAEKFRLELGKGMFIPGFEEQLIGTKKGDEKDVNVTFPEEYGAEALAGKDAVFEVKVHQVQAPEEVVVNDELAEKLGMESLEKLREAFKERIAQDYASMSRARLKRNLLDALDAPHNFEVPPSMLEAEEAQIWAQFEREMEQAGEKLEDQDKSEEELREEYRQIANRRVRLGLLLAEIGRVNNIAVSEEEMRNAMMQQAAQFPGQEKMLFEYYQQNPQALASLRAPIFEDKTVDFVLEMAEVTDVPVSKDELLRDPDADDADDKS
ncbi:MAG TPA: trigger factor [Alphaproteobacteria bacterium]|nr:trigger factor [Alphaproteobacteria bacterium]HBA43655.1 trigger factor [Alphaproteobacteria bacterium]HCO92130.1 trigger factor [Alphaproteobacteria bacterium]